MTKNGVLSKIQKEFFGLFRSGTTLEMPFERTNHSEGLIVLSGLPPSLRRPTWSLRRLCSYNAG